MKSTHLAVTFVALAALLGATAALAPKPWFLTDADVYERTARAFILPDCSDLQCFRVLVPWILGRIPGPPTWVWKGYAVLTTAGAAVALGQLCALLGLRARASHLAMWLLAFGFGPLLTLFNPYTPDPLMYLVGPVLLIQLIERRDARAGLLAGVGVFAKEVAAAPLWIFCIWATLQRRTEVALRTLAMAIGVALLWVALQLWLMLRYNYSYAGSGSTDLLHGGYLAIWLSYLGPRGALSVLFSAFGGLLVLAPAGFLRAPRDFRLLGIAALPAAALLSYVQQPDRALWNFHYAIIPFAALALEQLPAALCWTFVVCYAAANLRVGAQLPFIPAARYALAASMAISVAALVAAVRRPNALPAPLVTES